MESSTYFRKTGVYFGSGNKVSEGCPSISRPTLSCGIITLANGDAVAAVTKSITRKATWDGWWRNHIPDYPDFINNLICAKPGRGL